MPEAGVLGRCPTSARLPSNSHACPRSCGSALSSKEAPATTRYLSMTGAPPRPVGLDSPCKHVVLTEAIARNSRAGRRQTCRPYREGVPPALQPGLMPTCLLPCGRRPLPLPDHTWIHLAHDSCALAQLASILCISVRPRTSRGVRQRGVPVRVARARVSPPRQPRPTCRATPRPALGIQASLQQACSRPVPMQQLPPPERPSPHDTLRVCEARRSAIRTVGERLRLNTGLGAHQT